MSVGDSVVGPPRGWLRLGPCAPAGRRLGAAAARAVASRPPGQGAGSEAGRPGQRAGRCSELPGPRGRRWCHPGTPCLAAVWWGPAARGLGRGAWRTPGDAGQRRSLLVTGRGSPRHRGVSPPLHPQMLRSRRRPFQKPQGEDKRRNGLRGRGTPLILLLASLQTPRAPLRPYPSPGCRRAGCCVQIRGAGSLTRASETGGLWPGSLHFCGGRGGLRDLSGTCLGAVPLCWRQ